MKNKLLVALGATMVTAAAMGVAAFAATTSAQSDAANANGYDQYKTQIQAERQQLKTLEIQRKTLNAQIQSYLNGFKGHHVWKSNQSALQAAKSTHQAIAAARAKLQSDIQTARADRAAKNWSQFAADLGTVVDDLQNLVGLKQQQVANLQSVTGSGLPSGTSSDGADPAAGSTSSL